MPNISPSADNPGSIRYINECASKNAAVNFYLAGLHSYAKDDQEISIVFISITLLIIFILGMIAYPKYKKYLKNIA